jgi:hypothetical protein
LLLTGCHDAETHQLNYSDAATGKPVTDFTLRTNVFFNYTLAQSSPATMGWSTCGNTADLLKNFGIVLEDNGQLWGTVSLRLMHEWGPSINPSIKRPGPVCL